jgi:hypothetical protein
METLFAFVILIALISARISVLAGAFRSRRGRGKPWRSALRVARWLSLGTLIYGVPFCAFWKVFGY